MACLFSSSRTRCLAWLPLALLICAAPALAQDAIEQEPPAHISHAEGAVILERDGKTEASPASMPLLAGDRVRTQNGRAEILFADGSTLHLDAGTIVDFQSDEVIRLLEGRVRVNIAGPNRPVAYRIDAPSAWVDILQPGEYRVALVGGGRGEVELAVLRGAAELVNEDGTTRVRAGERAFAALGTAPSQPYVFNSAAWDSFDRWSEARRDLRLGVSAEYVPAEVQPYAATLATYGTWRHEPTYGYVWYPRVSVGWRPYYYGRWSHFRPWGWTWIGHDPWAWPTHHFGRWGFSAGVWFWIPGRRWAPAWVSWAYAPGYVSWCPLGFNNRPVFSFVNVNIFGGRRFDHWHGWTVVPHRRFGHGFVNINVVNVNGIDGRTRGAFTLRPTAPAFSGVAVPRSAAPIRLAGARSGTAVPRSGYAVPRSGSRATPAPGDREAFRSRGSAGAPLSGPGFPAPGREPRTAVPRGGERSVQPAAPSGERTVPSRRAVPSNAPHQGSGTSERSQGSAIRRAPGAVDAPSSDRAPSATPSRRAPGSVEAPSNQRVPSGAIRRAPEANVPAAPSPERMRAVPRRSETAPGEIAAPSRGPAMSAPSRTPGVERHEGIPLERTPSTPRSAPAPAYEPNRGTPAPRYDPGPGRRAPEPAMRAPEQPRWGGSRAAPRGGDPSPGGAPSYRAPERSMGRPPAAERPSGPPPGTASAPSRSAPSRSAPAQGQSRSGGQARPRGGGGD